MTTHPTGDAPAADGPINKFGPVERWEKDGILIASNEWLYGAFVVTEDPDQVGELGFHGPDEICVEYISPDRAKLWATSSQ